MTEPVYPAVMATPSNPPDPALESVRRRARRMRLRVTQPRRFDRFGLGALAALAIDVTGLFVLVLAHDLEPLYVLLLGPLTLALSLEVWIATGMVLGGASFTRRWRLVWGVLAVQGAFVLLGCLWPLVFSGGRWLPL